MKYVIRISLFLLATTVFCACGHKPYPQSLIVADSLTNAHPDSAVSLLKSLESTIQAEPEATQMYYRLLCIKAGDKAYKLHTSDSLILPVLHYYIEKDDERHLAEAYYYAGRVYRDLGDAPQALDYFEKALEALPEDKGGKLKGKIYSQMGTLFSYQEIHDEAMKMFRKAQQCDELSKDSLGMIHDLQDIAYEYRCCGKIDSTLYYYQKAYDLANIMQDSKFAAMVQSQMASLYTQQGKYDLARKALQPSLTDIDKPSKSSIFSIASELYHKTGQVDSATYYYRKLLQCGTVYAKKEAHQGLAKIALVHNNPQEASLHLSLYEHYIDSINQITDTQNIRRLNSLYNYQLREEENEQLKMKNEQKQTVIICILSIATLTVVATILVYIQYSKRKKAEYKMQIDRLDKLKEELHQRSALFIEDNKQKMIAFEEQLNEASRENTTLKSQLQKQKEIIFCTNKQAEIEWDEHEKAKAAFLKSDICTRFRVLAHPEEQEEKGNNIREGKKAKEQLAKEWILLEQGINSTYKGFSEKLKGLHKFNEHEWHICLLIKIGITPAEMATITAHSAESITATRRRLCEKVLLHKGKPKEWDKFISSF